ncbi:MAG TPA: DNA-binding protein WhiA [Candidatus Scatovivens faecipullorum]|jgi:hypothetical protein|nr:DNA-binding protein WhiA [Candidatus Scatovivens faecipullorum]
MSFSSEIKEELSKINNLKNKELIKSEFLGYILTGNTTNSENFLEFITENEFNIERFYKILFSLNIEYEPSIRGKVFVATIEKNEKVNELLQLKLDDADESKKAIVKGSFLGAGSINDPKKQYHLEIIFQEKNNAEYILNLCKSFNVHLKLLENKNKTYLYIKDAEEISKFLALIGASKAVLNLEEIRITKEIKNNVNRLVNCETANLNKIVNASVNQINDIKLIMNLKKFDELPDYLKEIAMIRLENPEVSLKSLGEMLENPIGKSGVNHRLQKIHEIAEELRQSK